MKLANVETVPNVPEQEEVTWNSYAVETVNPVNADEVPAVDTVVHVAEPTARYCNE